MSGCGLLAIDLDGTLLRDDGEIADEDRAAVERACADGMAVTLATGRLGPSTLPLARSLGLSAPLVCADGCATFCPETAALLEVSPLPMLALERLLMAARAAGTVPFLATPEALLGPPDSPVSCFLAGWTPQVLPTADLWEAVLGGPPLPVVAAFGVGPEDRVREVAAALGPSDEDVEIAVFGLGEAEGWAVRLTPAGASKAAALARIAVSLGLSPAQVAVIGDWYNDIAMMRWAKRSYAMGQAPAPVVQAARHHLRATARTGGGVAEAVEHLLGGSR
jgi:hydroxymethylpyrimidine pyrophosphatase-like HAD family hydrolase